MKKLFMAVFLLCAVALTAQVRVYTPTPNTPANGKEDQNPDVAISWLGVSNPNPVNYVVEYADNEGFNNAKTATVEKITGYAPGLLMFGQTYYWHVKAVDAVTGDESDWSEVFSFTVFNEIPLSKPSNGSDDEEPVVDLTWKASFSGVAISGIDGYEILLDTTESFDSPYLKQLFAIEGADRITSPELRFGEQFFWKIRAYHSEGNSGWSEVYDFFVIDEIELNKPKDGESDIQLDEEFSFKAIDGALKYEMQYDVNENFTEPFKVTVLHDGTSKPDTTFENMIFGQTYYWRARAIHRKDTSGWSEVRSVSTIAKPELIAPQNDSIGIPRQPQLVWEEMTGITYMEIEYAKNETFTEALFTDMVDGTRTTYNVLYQLDLSAQYFWRVRAIKVTDSSAWSDTRHFTISDGTGIEENSFSQISTYPNPVSEELNIEFNSSTAGEAYLSVYDLIGKKQLSLPISIQQGDNRVIVDMNDLNNGIYMMNIEGSNMKLTRKIVINK